MEQPFGFGSKMEGMWPYTERNATKKLLPLDGKVEAPNNIKEDSSANTRIRAFYEPAGKLPVLIDEYEAPRSPGKHITTPRKLTSSSAHAPVHGASPKRDAILSPCLTDHADVTHCPLGCGAELLLKLCEKHERDNCPLRLKSCPSIGCGAVFHAKNERAHLERECEIAAAQAAMAARGRAALEIIQCEACAAQVRRRDLQRHIEDSCPERSLICSREGCTEVFLAKHADEHERACPALTKTLRSVQRPQSVTCDLCGVSLSSTSINLHLREECPHRLVSCPNAELGCINKCAACEVASHLRHTCPVQSQRYELAQRAMARRELAVCKACACMVPIGKMEGHMASSCPNRLMPCRNWELGCTVKCRIMERTRHLNVDGLLNPRSCLYLCDTGRGAYACLDEDDAPAPWTAEFWIWRLPIDADASFKILVALANYKKYLDVASAERDAEALVRGLESRLRSTEAADAVDGGDSIRKALGDKIDGLSKNELLDELVTAASSWDNLKESAGVAFVTAERSLALALRTVRSMVAQASSEKISELNLVSGCWVKSQIRQTTEEDNFWSEWKMRRGQDLIAAVEELYSEALPEMRQSEKLSELLRMVPLNRKSDGKKGPNGISKDRQDQEAISLKKKEKKMQRNRDHAEKFGIRVEKRIYARVTNEGGWGTLAASNDALIQLEVGQADRVAYVLPGKVEHVFDYQCPREKWVHLALVCDGNDLYLYEGGQPAGRIKGVGSLPLPMRDLAGGRNRPPNCLIQEVRYWGVERSAAELADAKHDILPLRSSEDGLVGYWTLEEGSCDRREGNYVHDVTNQRYRVKVKGEAQWFFPEVDATSVQEAPTPAWLERNVCKVELRRAKLAQRGRSHLLEEPCSAGCGDSIMKKNQRFHAQYICRLRRVSCNQPGCSAVVPFGNLQEHLHSTECSFFKRTLDLASRNATASTQLPCRKCSQLVQVRHSLSHRQNDCPWRLVRCELQGCGLLLPYRRLATHQARYCQSPTVQRKLALQHSGRLRFAYDRPWAISYNSSTVGTIAIENE